MRHATSILLPLLLLAGCGDEREASWPKPGPGQIAKGGLSKVTEPSLTEARRGFAVKPVQRLPAEKAAPEPPPNVFRLLRFDSPVGKLAAYLSPNPGDGRKHPAIIWITGGDCNSIDGLWKRAPRENDQTAAAYRKAGIIMMFPSLRGGNDNPGQREGFFGEVDGIIAAADYLIRQDYVDPQRVYLGGHSTGGTLVMLVAESTDRFRAVFILRAGRQCQRLRSAISSGGINGSRRLQSFRCCYPGTPPAPARHVDVQRRHVASAGLGLCNRRRNDWQQTERFLDDPSNSVCQG
jgi:pimeloyl-ACP methyl ester carboxylesterase